MKNFTRLLIVIVSFLLIPFGGFSQDDEHKGHHHEQLNEKAAFEKFHLTAFLDDFSKIALRSGYSYHFDECLRNAFIGKQSNLYSEIFNAYVEKKSPEEFKKLYEKHLIEFSQYLELFARNEVHLRSEFKKRVESSHSSLNKISSPLPSPQAACNNMDFETGDLTGWTTTTSGGGASYATTTGPDPLVNPINQVFNGNNSACIDALNTSGNLDWVQIEQTFLVTNSNKDFIFYTAVIIDRPGHTPCSDNAKFEVSVKDASNNVIPCSNVVLIGADASGVACSAFNGFQTLGSYDYLNWTPVIVPLGGYVGQNVTISFRVTRCNGGGGHGARAYVEASCNPVALNASGSVICSGSPVNLSAPNTPGYSYNWTGPGGFSGNTASVFPTQAGVYTVTMSVTSNPACRMIMDTVLTAAPSPTANFNYTVTPCAPTNSVPVISSSTAPPGDPISSYTWIWGDATANGTGSSTNHVYASTGTKTVELKVMTNGGCRDSIKQSFSFNPGPIAAFSANNDCLNTSTNFSSTATPTAVLASHTWDFGDGTGPGSGLNPSHTYTSPGIKNVTYTATSTDGCSSVLTKTVNVFPNPAAALSANTVCLGLPTTFGNTSSVSAPDNISTWSWDFDNNGTVDNGTQTPTNTYTVAGNFTVELKVVTNNGCMDSLTIPVKVNALPTATFTPINACVNTNVILNNMSAIAAPDFINSSNWNFGAGASPATSSSVNPTPLVYSTSGIKNITLNITANTSCTATITQTVQVYAQPVANFSTTSVCQSTATAFTDLSTPTGSIVAWSWDFTNNGSIDNTTNAPTHVYPASGTYSTSLMVMDNNTCKDTIVLPLNVWGHSIPDFTPTTVCFGAATNFSNTTNTTTNQNVGVVSGWSWDFADGNTSLAQDPVHTYTTGSGSAFNVTLTATTTNGCMDNVVKAVTINALPTATFTPVNACMNANVLLNNTSTIPLPDIISNYAWSFGAGSAPTTTSNIQNPPLLSYNSSGIKSITLMVTANTTCTASITQTVDIYPQPVANFSTTSVCQSTATAYTDLSTTSVGTITGWQWDFTNNSSIDNTTNAPSNVFVASGTFTTSLIATSSNGCKDTVALPVNVWGHTIPDFYPDKVCFGTATTFTNLTNESTNANVGTGTNYLWNFADGNTSGSINPNHTYTMGGNANATYSVLLVATSQHGCIDSIRKAVSVFAVPTASFTSDSVCLGTSSQMIDASNGNGNIINTYAWDFLSDGVIDISGVANPNFIFPNFGINQVTYTVSTSPVTGLVCANTTNTISVWVNPNPVPNFSFVDKCINAQPNTFNGSSSTIAIGTNTAYVWAYGDGAVSTPTTASASTHSYIAAGVYNVTLTVTSNKGCQTMVSKQTEVFEKPYIQITNSTPCDQVAMTYTAISQANSGTVTQWAWDLDDMVTGMEGNAQTVSYTYPTPGSHTISLLATTNHGCTETFTNTVYVNYNPVAVFSGDDLSGCPIPNHCVNFTDASPAITGPSQISQWQWTMGDGTTINNPTSAPVNHCYGNSSSSQLAFFSVSLVVTTDSGCVSQVNNKPNYITVFPTPIADYTVNPNPGNILTPLEYFTNQSVDYTKWWWSFGDGPFKSDSVNVDPTHFYSEASADTYYTNLIVMNQYGCRDTAYVAVEIQPEFTFYIPNAFSPANSDNINDVFTGKGIGIASFEMWIYDRWGERVFYTDDIEKGWDGHVQGKSGEEKQDVYTWKVKLKDVLGKKHDYIGHVTLLR
jgi:gliding motility-associated-like protein